MLRAISIFLFSLSKDDFRCSHMARPDARMAIDVSLLFANIFCKVNVIIVDCPIPVDKYILALCLSELKKEYIFSAASLW